LEKRDAEALELIRSGHEVTLLKSMRAMKEKSIEEAKETVESLKASLESAEHRQAFYRDRERLSATERDQQTNLELVECLSASRPRI
jgi:ribosomal protein L7/L12